MKREKNYWTEGGKKERIGVKKWKDNRNEKTRDKKGNIYSDVTLIHKCFKP